MSHITVLGGNGYTGAAVVAEAVRRGHAVTVVSRSTPNTPVEGVRYVTGSALEPAILADAVAGADVVVSATSSRGGEAQAQPGLASLLIDAVGSARLVVVGGVSSLRPSAGAPRFIEGHVAEEYRVEALAGHASLEALLAAPESVDWVFFSPAKNFGSWIPGEATGAYRLGGDVAILDSDGSSVLYAEDLALAILDVIESGEHSREHLSVVS